MNARQFAAYFSSLPCGAQLVFDAPADDDVTEVSPNPGGRRSDKRPGSPVVRKRSPKANENDRGTAQCHAAVVSNFQCRRFCYWGLVIPFP